MDLDEGDFLIGAAVTDGEHDVMLFSERARRCSFDENDVRSMGRTARGVRGMALDEGQSVIAMLVADSEQQSVLTATEKGYGKRTPVSEYTRHGRGTKGMIAIQALGAQRQDGGRDPGGGERRDHADHQHGVLVRTRVSEIREMGRATQGVTLIDVEDDDALSGVQRIVETEAADVIVANALEEQESAAEPPPEEN